MSTQVLSDAGVSIWLDDLSRPLLTSGKLLELIDTRHVVGVTTNPAIFQASISKGEGYEEQLDHLAAAGVDPVAAIEAITTDDVRQACDVFAETFAATGGTDGRVSIEVDPRLAHDTEQTIEQAKHLWERVDRPNAMIKIPATVEGLPAITAVIATGISVNTTLIFSLDRYRAVAEAYIDGLEQARDAGIDLATIESVASVFISRIDGAIDPLLDDVDGGAELKGKVAVANALLMAEAYDEIFSSPRFIELANMGAKPQRLLWASTGVKNPDYPATKYVDELVTANVVNTMPGKTLEAVADAPPVVGDTVRDNIEDARSTLTALGRTGIDLFEVTAELEADGVKKFEDAWVELIDTVTKALQRD